MECVNQRWPFNPYHLSPGTLVCGAPRSPWAFRYGHMHSMVGQMANWPKSGLNSWPISLFTLASQGLACTSEGGRSKTSAHRCLSTALIQPFSASCQALKAILHFATLHDALIPSPKVYRDELTSCLGLIGSAIQGQGGRETTGGEDRHPYSNEC